MENEAWFASESFRLLQDGDFSAAKEGFQKSLQLRPVQGLSYYGLAQCQKFGPADGPSIERMESTLTNYGLVIDDKALIHFALGKAYDDLADYAAAFKHYQRGNKLFARIRFRTPFDQARYRSGIDWAINVFSKDLFQSNPSIGIESHLPVQIVGMMRSGTSLLEQILTSHPEVGGSGEINYWLGNGRRAMDPRGVGVNPDAIPPLAKEYERLLIKTSPGNRRVTDKTPHNLVMLGLIHLSFPHSQLIHCRRNALDTCLSIFMTGYLAPPEFAHNLDNIVFALKENRRLADHWKEVLPEEIYSEVTYESLVSDRRPVIENLLNRLDLEWDDSCLNHEKNQRVVSTASLWQVRQPIYRSSVARWMNYEPYLSEEMVSELRDL